MGNTNPKQRNEKGLEDTTAFLDLQELRTHYKNHKPDIYERPDIKEALRRGETVILYKTRLPLPIYP